jgi:hypothetical protein
VAALLARAVERAPSLVPQQVARLTIDLLRPVPLTPLEVRTTVSRDGKRVSFVEASLLADGTEVARCAALRIRSADLPVPAEVVPGDAMPPGEVGAGTEAIELGPFNDRGVEIRFVEGGFHLAGPGVAWIRLRRPLVAGEEPTPLIRMAAAADLGNGLSSVLKQREWMYINPELTVHVARPPVGEWIGLRSTTYPGPHGAGLAESALYDATGRIGRATQSLLFDRR